MAATVFRPVHELKGFTKVHSGPDQARRVTVVLDRRAFAFWDVARHEWTVEPGDFEIWLGASFRDIRWATVVAIDAAPVDELVPGPPQYHWVTAMTTFTRDAFRAALRSSPTVQCGR